MVSETTEKFFPHEKIREGQDELVKDIEKVMIEGKILLAHAPTGLGKTASVLAVAVPPTLEKKKRVFFLTNRHTQHRIAIETLKLMKQKTGEEIGCVDLIGKRGMCLQEVKDLVGNDFQEFCKTIIERGECEFYNNVRQKNKLTVEAKKVINELKTKSPWHNEEIQAIGQERKMCSYELALASAQEAQIFIGDYYYIFNPFIQKTLFTKLDLAFEKIILIVDEGHNLPGRITEMLSANLSSYTIKNTIMEAKRFKFKGVILWLQELNRILQALGEFPLSEKNKEREVTKEEFLQAVKRVVDYDEFLNELELGAEEVRKKQRKSYLGGIANFLSAWLGEDKGYLRMIAEHPGRYGPTLVLSYLCLDPTLITKEVFTSVPSGIIMSGTLKPTFMYKDVLGIERGVEKEYSSPFPRENKLSLIIPQTTTKYTLRGEAMYKKIAQKCSELSLLIPGNLAFYFPSYELRDRIGNFISTPKKMFWEKSEMEKEEKEDFLDEFRAEREKGGVLLGVAGANFAEGIDLPGDLLNGVVVVGLPLAKPDLKTRKIIDYYEQKFGRGWDYGYIYPAMNKCLQSAGRCIRSETDKGAIIFLDERFAWPKYHDCLPREGLIVSKNYEKLLKEFF